MIELFGDVVFAVGVLERQVELVGLRQRHVASGLQNRNTTKSLVELANQF